jgi:glycosyltransferase involved in cell wall biosynthesis
MRVLWVLYGDLDQATGGTIYDRLIVEGLRARGHEVAVLSLVPRGRLFGLLASDELIAHVQRSRPDVVVGDELCFAELAGAFSRLRSVPRVLLVHHLSCWEPERTPLDRAVAHLLEGWALRASDRVISTSHATARRLARDHKTAGVEVVHPGADRLPRGRRDPSSLVRLLFVGTWTERKGLLRLLDALHALPPEGWALSIVGEADRDPAYASRVRAQLERMSGCAITVRGRLHDPELAPVYDAHDVLVLPTSFEGFGMVLAEALYAGLEVITTRAGATVEAAFGSPRATFVEDDLVPVLRALVSRATLANAPVVEPWDASALPTWQAAIESFEALLSR